ncbi:hypothetical protein J4G37_09245 [Microvirga sp. 3-52]|nr:hypothetical protein [Microvirga sp. 3-52]
MGVAKSERSASSRSQRHHRPYAGDLDCEKRGVLPIGMAGTRPGHDVARVMGQSHPVVCPHPPRNGREAL